MSAIAAAPPESRARAHNAGSNHRPPEITIPEMFRSTVERSGDRSALLHKVDGKWQPITYRELQARVTHFANGLIRLGIAPGECVSLLSENRPEWAITDLALTSIGAINVPLYATLPPPQVEYIVADSQSVALIVSNQKQLEKALEIRKHLPLLRHLIVIDPPEKPVEGVLLFSEICEHGAVADAEQQVRRRAEAVRPTDLATIIYTSGTTGSPKGAVLTHDNFMSNAQSVQTLVEIRPDDLFLSFLPLSHVFERMAGHYLPLTAGSTVAYAESIFSVQNNMVELKPTVMASVPRLYESIHSRVLDGIAKQPAKKRKTAEWALRVGWAYHSKRVRGEQPDLLTALQYPLANKLVLQPLRERVTGDRLRFFISGGAPLPVKTAEFITGIGLHVLEGYGLTETSPVICVNRPEKTKIGTVGPPIPGVEVRIAPDGEILSRGPHIMRGYYNKPDETAQAIDSEGWFHTGDIGVLDEDGYLKITDRKKDIIVLANGKNVAPQPIEARVKASPLIANVVLFGDREPQIVALIVPDMDHLKQWARKQGLDTKDTEELLRHPQVKKLYRAEIEAMTKDLADFEKIRRFTLLPRDFSQERGELTPTLKIKRQVVAKHYENEIRALYGGKHEA
jgi:long-chain acyl-CoA synthetase